MQFSKPMFRTHEAVIQFWADSIDLLSPEHDTGSRKEKIWQIFKNIYRYVQMI